MNRLAEQVFVVTGAASGIGEAIARRFAAEGARVLVADIDHDRGRRVADEIDGVFGACDVTSEPAIASSIAHALDRFGRLDGYVANAGFSFARGSIVDLDALAFDRTVALLLRAVALGMKHACGVFRANGGGTFISTSSVAALLAGLGPHAYSACKAGVIALTRSVAAEEAPYGTRVNCLLPGSIITHIQARTFGVADDFERTEELSRALTRAHAPSIPLGYRGSPAQVAAAAAWLASDDASYVTGQAIVIDGGLSIEKRLPVVPALDGAR